MEIELNNVNQIPALTWNFLKMNSSSLKVIVSPEQPREYIVGKIPEEIQRFASKQELEDATGIDFEQESIETGMGEEATAFTRDHANVSYYLATKKNQKVCQPVVFDYDLTKQESCIEDNLIYVAEGSELTLMFQYSSETECFHGGTTKILIDKYAKVNVIQTQLFHKGSVHFDNIGIKSRENSEVTVTQMELGAKKVWSGVKIDLAERGAKSELKSAYVGHDTQELDFNYVTVHHGKKTISQMDTKGILTGHSKKLLRGTIDLVKGCSGSSGNEAEDVLLLDSEVKNQTIPIILCDEDDVEGNHAATIGEMNPEQFYYLQTRGLSIEEVKNMLILGRIRHISSGIPDEKLQEKIIKYCEEVLHHE